MDNQTNNTVSNEVETPQLTLGENIILDIGGCGYYFHQALCNFFKEPWCIEATFQATVSDLIRIIQNDPPDVIEIIKTFPDQQSINSVVLSIDHLDYDELVLICQEHILALYLKLKPQIVDSKAISFVPAKIGMDYVVMTEVVPV